MLGSIVSSSRRSLMDHVFDTARGINNFRLRAIPAVLVAFVPVWLVGSAKIKETAKRAVSSWKVSRTIACLKRPLFLFGLPRPKPSGHSLVAFFASPLISWRSCSRGEKNKPSPLIWRCDRFFSRTRSLAPTRGNTLER